MYTHSFQTLFWNSTSMSALLLLCNSGQSLGCSYMKFCIYYLLSTRLYVLLVVYSMCDNFDIFSTALCFTLYLKLNNSYKWHTFI